MTIWVTADDYGLDPGINEAIEVLAEKNRITAVSVMTHADAALDSVDNLPPESVYSGVHLTFTLERPLLDDIELDPLLDRSGRLPASHWVLAKKLALHPRAVGALQREAEAQIKRFLGLGLPLNFVNSHQHVHLYPPLWAALVELLREYPIAAIRQAASLPITPNRTGLVVIASRVSWRRWPLPKVVRLEPIGLHKSGRMGAREVGRILSAYHRPPAGCRTRQTELIVHPGIERPGGVRARYGHWDDYSWASEFEQLASGAIQTMVERHGWEIVKPANSEPLSQKRGQGYSRSSK